MGAFQGQRVWVTGASSGIGEALAMELAKEGASIILTARRKDKLDTLVGLLSGSGHEVLPLDLTDQNAVVSACDRVGRVDMLINNAGISQRSLTLDTDMKVYRQLMELDFFSVVDLTKRVLPGMIERGSGHIVTISSVIGKVSTPYRSGYAAAKAAVFGFMDSLRAEMHAEGIDVTIVAPGYIATDVARNALTGEGVAQGHDDPATENGMSAEDCAKGIVKGLKKKNPEIVVAGTKEKVAWRLAHYAPSMLRRMVRSVQVK